jgi:hypothetical protein
MLSQTDLVDIWETGQPQHGVDRALTILAQADPTHSRHDFADFPIGERDRRLLDIREQSLGHTIKSMATCPRCSERVEFVFDTANVRTPPSSADEDKDGFKLVDENYVINFRLLTSWDLAAIAACTDEMTATSLLIKRCVLGVDRNGISQDIAEVPDRIIQQLQKTISERDPQAEILLDLKCPACEAQWQLLFDIAAFLWEEIATQAERLLDEVHTLAGAYGWAEKEILALSPVRRRYYIERITL